MAVISIGDIDLFYRDFGSGPPLVLLMGFTANADWWPEAFIQEIAHRHRVIVVDNRGAGRSPRGQKRFTMKQAAADTVALLDALQISKAHVFGISMGGMIAQEIAISHGERLDHLVLGCTMARPFTGFLSGLPGQGRLLGRYLYDKKVRRRPWVVNIMFSEPFLEKNPLIPLEFIDMVSKARIKPRAWGEQLLAIMTFNGWSRLGSIRHPALVIAGDQDLLIASKQSQNLAARLVDSRLIMMPGLGHAFVGEAPETIAKQVISFLSNQEKP